MVLVAENSQGGESAVQTQWLRVLVNEEIEFLQPLRYEFPSLHAKQINKGDFFRDFLSSSRFEKVYRLGRDVVRSGHRSKITREDFPSYLRGNLFEEMAYIVMVCRQDLLGKDEVMLSPERTAKFFHQLNSEDNPAPALRHLYDTFIPDGLIIDVITQEPKVASIVEATLTQGDTVEGVEYFNHKIDKWGDFRFDVPLFRESRLHFLLSYRDRQDWSSSILDFAGIDHTRMPFDIDDFNKFFHDVYTTYRTSIYEHSLADMAYKDLPHEQINPSHNYR